MLIKGTLMKGYSSFYYVYADGRVWESSLRGRFRVKKQDFIPGDSVVILPGTGDKATIEEVVERKNSLTRPYIANVDQAILVFACKTPDPDYNLLDRILVQVEEAGIDGVIIFTKSDLAANEVDPAINYYREAGYTVLCVSNKTGEGIESVRNIISKKITVLAGPSGSGKSSLINSLEPDRGQKTGTVSERIGRGKHTTRHVELIPVAGGLVADTPGFSSLFMPEIKKEELRNYFPEFEKYSNNCRFKSCMHDKEPVCGVKDALGRTEIMASRYEHYQQFLKEINERKNRY